MKLTESRIKEIILEELENAQKEQEQQPEEKLQSDVETMLKGLPRIDSPKEYTELIQSLMKYKPKGMSDSQKLAVLRNLRDLLNQLLKGGSK